MIAYEEFMKKYNIEKLENLSFSDEKGILSDATILDNPSQYIDIAKKAQDLKFVTVAKDRDSEYYKALKEFTMSCPEDVKILNGVIGNATKEEFFKGEEIIEGIIEQINPDWSTKQKAAYVHYQMGKLISYAPDFNFVERYVNNPLSGDTRNIWKSLVKGVSVCNGITTIQRNILSRIGIKTQELSSGTHTYTLIETEEGNIISDATWDLQNGLYGARPRYFGKTYEQLREQEKGLSNAHKLENPPENVIEISEQELREIYCSLGYTNEDRSFLFPMLYKVEEIESQNFENETEKVQAFFKMFTQNFQEEAKHLSETRGMLEQCVCELGIKRSDLTTKFVYGKDDEQCEKPYLVLHIANEDMKDSIQLLNLEEMQFDNIDLQHFDEQYKTHRLDTRTPFWKSYLEQTERPNGEQIKEK